MHLKTTPFQNKHIMSMYRFNQVYIVWAYIHTSLDFWLLQVKIEAIGYKLCHRIQVYRELSIHTGFNNKPSIGST